MRMSHPGRAWLAALLACAAPAIAAPAAQAGFGVEEHNFEAGTCTVSSCTYSSPQSEFYTQAAGHPPWGLTTFELNHRKGLLGEEPEGAIKRVRVDLPAGLAADPQAPPEQCSASAFQVDACGAGSVVGTTEMVVYDGVNDLAISGTVYDLSQPPGLPLDFGIYVAPLAPLITPVRLYLEGHVSWSSDYHEYFEINNIPTEAELLGGIKTSLAVLKSKLNFDGRSGGGFLTLPSECSSTTVSTIEVESWEGAVARTQTHTPVGVDGCQNVPFEPTSEVKAETAQSDLPDGGTVEIRAPQHGGGGEIDTADIQGVHLTLPEGLTLNPPAARGLGSEACTAAQIGIGTTNAVGCPAASSVGTVAIYSDLPAPLTGGVYLGSPDGGPITGPPYTIYIDAESVYGVSVRLRGLVNPNPSAGRLEATFSENPQLPFSALVLTMKGGAQAPLANPLVCGEAPAESVFTPFTAGAPWANSSLLTTTGCPSPLPFSLRQSTQSSSSRARGYTSYTFNLGRDDGQQYLSQVRTVLPPGLVGAIPSVPLCGEPSAQAGTCSSANEIGTATAGVGSGPEPFVFTGKVYLTGPYNGAPYGLSIALPAVAGPFDLGGGTCDCVLTRAGVNVDPHSASVVVTSGLPTIVKGVPLRLRSLSVTVDRTSFLFNPTNCGALATQTTLTSTFGATQALSSPFQVTDCAALAFKPSFAAATSGKTSKATGASLRVRISQPAHEANMRSVVVQLPKQMPSRLTTLQQACPEATYAANPYACPKGSKVGSTVVATPVLSGKLTGPAYLVSHGGAGFPDLDLLLEDRGVRVIVVGNTNIRRGVTTSTFATIPDVPVSSFTLDLPAGPYSALAASGSLCAKPLIMPTTITGQNGARIKQNTRLAVAGCGPREIEILRHRIVGHELILTVKTAAAGRIAVRAKDLRTVFRRVGKATSVRLGIRLSPASVRALHRGRALKIHATVGFLPSRRGASRAAASANVVFNR